MELIGSTYEIDVNPRDGNLLAAGGSEGNIKIYDRRSSEIVKVLGKPFERSNFLRHDMR